MVKKPVIPPQVPYVKSQMDKRGNPLGASPKELSSWAEGLDIPRRGETILHVGCMYPILGRMEALLDTVIKLGAERVTKLGTALGRLGFDRVLMKFLPAGEKSGERVRRIAVALKSLGINFAYLGPEEPCCGEVLYNLGYHDAFVKHANRVAEKLRELGVKRMIVLAPFCAYALKKVYPKVVDGWDIEVKTLAEVLAEALRERGLRLGRKLRVTYHDPCYYARFLGIVDEPREALYRIRGVELIEPRHTGLNTKCVGDGGIELTYPELADEVAVMRVRELIETGARVIVTQCPACILMIKRGLKKLGRMDVEITDLGELVYRAVTQM